MGGDTVAAYLAARQSNKAHSTADQERAEQKAEEERLAALSAEEAAAEAAEAAAAAEAEAKAAAEAEAALQKEAEEAAAQAEAEAEAKRKEEEEEAAAAEAEAQAEVETDADDEKPQEVEVEAEEEEEEEDRGPPPEPAELPPLPEGMADIPELQAQAATLRTVLQVSESWPGIVAVGDFTTGAPRDQSRSAALGAANAFSAAACSAGAGGHRRGGGGRYDRAARDRHRRGPLRPTARRGGGRSPITAWPSALPANDQMSARYSTRYSSSAPCVFLRSRSSSRHISHQ